MRAVFVLFSSILVTACSSNTQSQKEYFDSIPTFKTAMRMGCNVKHPNSKEVCSCRADVLHEVTPPEIRRNFAYGGSVMKIVKIMLENSEKLDACGKLPRKEKYVPKKCYSGDDKPSYYLSETHSNSLKLSSEQKKLIEGIDPSVDKEKLVNSYYSSISEDMKQFGQQLNSNVNLEKSSSSVNMNDLAQKTIQCTDATIRKFYTESEVDSLYKLHYAGYTIDDSQDAIFQHSMVRRNMENISEEQQRKELRKYIKCELTICMKR